MQHYNQKNKGFTLIETLTTIIIFVILMGGISLLFKTIYSDSNQQKASLSTIDQARIIGSTFSNEIRNSTYGVDGSFPLNQASTTQVIFYSTFGASTSTSPIRIRYYSSGTSLYKGTLAPTGSPLAYTSGNEVTTIVQAGISNNGSTPIFYYYDGNYAGTSTPLTQPVNLNQVKFVKINMVILKQDIRNSTSTFTVIAGGALRNIKTNLGN